MNIRLAISSDTFKISQTHRTSIQSLCKDHYTDDVIKNWTAILEPEIYESAIEEKILIVSVKQNELYGFGILDVDNSELCALYIHPDHTKKGIANDLLNKIESIAIENSITNLKLCSTLNAVNFYKHQKYVEAEKTFHLLPDGTKIECVKMLKTLTKCV